MALVDGQLAPAEVPALVQELARNATLLAELQDYLATSRCRIAAAYAGKADEPVPPRLVDAILTPPAEPRMPQRAAAAPWLGRRLLDWLRSSARVPTWSLAAAPALAAAAAFALAVHVMPTGGGGALPGVASSDLGATLERTASGKDAPLATVRPMLSFNSKDAGWCRQFEVRSAGRQTSHGLACRGQSGGWRLIAATAPSASGGFAPAGADRRKVIDNIVTSMIDGEPLSPDGEAAVIGKGWQL